MIITVILCLTLNTNTADGHWNMETRFWADDSNERFYLRIHNGAHANRNPVKKELSVCFWIEDVAGGSNKIISEKKCNTVIMKPDEWMTFEFAVRDVTIHKDAKSGGKLKKGNYRVVAMAREQRNKLLKLLLGAAMERVYAYFEVKSDS